MRQATLLRGRDGGEFTYQRLGVVELAGEPLANDVAERRLCLAVIDVPADHNMHVLNRRCRAHNSARVGCRLPYAACRSSF